jgi:hypothetical protein
MIKNFNVEKREANSILKALGIICSLAAVFFFIRPVLLMIAAPDAFGNMEWGYICVWWCVPEFIAIIFEKIFLSTAEKDKFFSLSFDIDDECIRYTMNGYRIRMYRKWRIDELNSFIHVTNDGVTVMPEGYGVVMPNSIINYSFKTETGRDMNIVVYTFGNNPTQDIDVYIDGELVVSKSQLIKKNLKKSA